MEDPELPGTFLIISPYKAAIKHYLAEKEKLPDSVRGRVEVRTWDSSQGNEADIVIIDYVRGCATDFMDGMHRFNVGLTRARQGELHIMQPRLINSGGFWRTKYLCNLYRACRLGIAGRRHGHLAIARPE